MKIYKNRILILLIQLGCTEIISIIIQKCFFIKFNNMILKHIIDNAIIIGTFLAIIIMSITYIRWKILDFINREKERIFKLEQANNDHALRIKFLDAVIDSHPKLKADIQIMKSRFTREELKYLKFDEQTINQIFPKQKPNESNSDNK